jgi:hypothetical protein
MISRFCRDGINKEIVIKHPKLCFVVDVIISIVTVLSLITLCLFLATEYPVFNTAQSILFDVVAWVVILICVLELIPRLLIFPFAMFKPHWFKTGYSVWTLKAGVISHLFKK